MENFSTVLGVLTLLFFALTPVAIVAYVRLSLRMRRDGGAVETSGFVFADLLVAAVLAIFFSYFMVTSWPNPHAPQPPIKIDQVLPGELFLVAIAAGVGGFILYRGGNLLTLFGLTRISAARVGSLAFLFVLGGLPVVWLTNLMTSQLLHEVGGEQQLVLLFREEAKKGHYNGVMTILVTGVILAPCVEEFLFRGFFYGVMKRYFGAIAAGVCSALLFAAFHTNLASLPGLFVLALCLTVAYERSGSLFVPIVIHALFNLSNLALLYLQAVGVISP